MNKNNEGKIYMLFESIPGETIKATIDKVLKVIRFFNVYGKIEMNDKTFFIYPDDTAEILFEAYQWAITNKLSYVNTNQYRFCKEDLKLKI